MCPYSDWQRGLMTFCELQRCSWIREPLNTFSNLGFVLVGLVVLRRYWRVPQVRLIGASALLVGILSGFYHATSSLFGENLDLASMYLLMASLLCFNLQRLGFLSVKASEMIAIPWAIAAVTALMLSPHHGPVIFEYQVYLTFLLELINFLIARRKGRLTYSYRFLLLAVVSHSVAFLFWYLDFHRHLCLPESLVFQGHALWHLLEAVTFICLTRFYLQFNGRYGLLSVGQPRI